MDLERNLVESCAKATDRDTFSSHIVEVILRATASRLACDHDFMISDSCEFLEVLWWF